jgi:hypothetical protein
MTYPGPLQTHSPEDAYSIEYRIPCEKFDTLPEMLDAFYKDSEARKVRLAYMIKEWK